MNICRILVGKPEGKRPLGKPKCTLGVNVKMSLTEIGWSGVDRIDLVEDRDHWRALVYTVMNHLVPVNFEKLLSN
jgi:hypothetical protein